MTTYEPPAEAVEKADTDPEVQRIAAALGVNPAERESFIRAALTAAGPIIAAEALREWIAEWPTTPSDGTFLADVARNGLERAASLARGEGS